MKKVIGCVVMCVAILMLVVRFAQSQQVKVWGFGQVKLDKTNFSIPKVRIGFNGPIEVGLDGLSLSYSTCADFGRDGKSTLVTANLTGKFKEAYLPEIIVGRDLDSFTRQWPTSASVPTLNYPSASFNRPIEIGLFLKESYRNFWAITAVTNGSSSFEDDNKSLDFSSRVTYKLPYSFEVGGIFRTGHQPDGDRKFQGGDMTWRTKGIWINGGQNVMDYNGQKIGRWLWSTIDLNSWFQLVGLVESLKQNDETTTSWTAGVNISPTTKTIIRADYFKLAKDGSKGWGILFQQSF